MGGVGVATLRFVIEEMEKRNQLVTGVTGYQSTILSIASQWEQTQQALTIQVPKFEVDTMFRNLALGAVQSLHRSIADSLQNAFQPFLEIGSLFSELHLKHQRHVEALAAWLEIDPSAEHEYYDALSYEEFRQEAYAVRWIKETAQQDKCREWDSVKQLTYLVCTGQLSEYTYNRFSHLLFGGTPSPQTHPIIPVEPKLLPVKGRGRGQLACNLWVRAEIAKGLTIGQVRKQYEERYYEETGGTLADVRGSIKSALRVGGKFRG